MGFLPPPDSRCGTATKKTHNLVRPWWETATLISGKCERQSYVGPVSEGQHQRHEPRLQSGQSCKVIGGEARDIISCAHFAHQPTAETTNNSHQLRFIIINVFKLFNLCVQQVFIVSRFYCPHETDLATSLQKTTGTLAWKSDSTSANATGDKSETRVNLGSRNSSLVHTWTFSCWSWSIVKWGTFMIIGSGKRLDTL